jgi:hypothetical protein
VTKATKLPCPSESHEMKCLARYLDARRLLWCHAPNEGARDPRYAARLKAEGVKAGVPDVLIFEPFYAENDRDPFTVVAKKVGGIAIELKRRDRSLSRVTPAESRWLVALQKKGWVAEACYGADEAIELVKRYIPERVK